MMRRTRATSRRRRSMELSAKALRSSMSRRVTPGMPATPGSTSRGTAMSTISSGRPKRRCMATSISSCVITTSVAPVEVSTRSAVTSACGSCSMGTARPPTRMATSVERSVPGRSPRPRPHRDPASERAMPSPISPAPSTRTRCSTRRAEPLCGQGHRRRRQRHGAPADAGLGPGPLPDLDGEAEHPAQALAGRALLFGHLHGVAHLAEDLRPHPGSPSRRRRPRRRGGRRRPRRNSCRCARPGRRTSSRPVRQGTRWRRRTPGWNLVQEA